MYNEGQERATENKRGTVSGRMLAFTKNKGNQALALLNGTQFCWEAGLWQVIWRDVPYYIFGEPAIYISPVGWGMPPLGSSVTANAPISFGSVTARFSILK